MGETNLDNAPPLEGAIVYSRCALDIVTSPWLVGTPLAALARTASGDWIRTLAPQQLGATPVSLEILNGGHYYYVAAALTDVTGLTAGVATVRAKRRLEHGAWRVRVWERAGAPLAGASSILIGDTLATGTTLNGVLLSLLQELGAAPCPPVFVFAIAGASACETALAPAASAIRQAGGQLHLAFANAAFHLAPDGTDLKFDGPAARWHPAAAAELPARLGGLRLKCACFDWGDRFRLPGTHLAEVAAWAASLPGGPPPWLVRGLEAAAAAEPWEAAP